MLKINRKEGQLDWTVFNTLPEEVKSSFLLPNGQFLRIIVYEDKLRLFVMNSPTREGVSSGIYIVNRKDGSVSDNYQQLDEREADIIYKTLCFIFLTENTETILNPKATHTSGLGGRIKIQNCLSVPLIIVNKRWNTKTIRQESFGVRGHFAIRWTGKGGTIAKVIFIEPYEKGGLVRKSGKELSSI